ncbi:MAG: hypothetical protein RR515_02320 [Clostridium sp.]
MSLKFKLQYQYQMVLALNAEAKMEEIAKEIEAAKSEFNNKSQTAKVVKQIVDIKIENNFLLLTLGSDNPLSSPSRALFVFTQSIIKNLRENGRENIIGETVKRKGFFKSVGKAKELKNIKGTNSDVSIIPNSELQSDLNLKERLFRIFQDTARVILDISNPVEREKVRQELLNYIKEV